MYLLWSGRLQGWLGNSGVYTTDLKEARVCEREEALAICRKHKVDGAKTLFPVAQADLDAI
jgi:hypothetical protein